VRLALLVITLAIVTPRTAAALVICNMERGIAPRTGSVLPPHPRLVSYGFRGQPLEWVATIGGEKIGITAATIEGAMGAVTTLDIKSDRTGKLVINLGKVTVGTFTIASKLSIAREVPVVIGRYKRQVDQNFIDGSFDGLGIWLPEGVPAILAHVRLRRDDQAPWFEIVVPVVSTEGQPRPVIRIGALGCSANFPLAMLAKGVDIDVVVTAVDGTKVRVTNLAPHLTLPEPLPPQPRARVPRAP
jgi:hypothetical protein